MTEQDYLDISFAPDRKTLEDRLIDFANRLDFGIISGALIVENPGQPDQYITIGNTPEAFIASHKSVSNGLRDPVLARLKRLNIPITYDQKLYVESGSADLWDNQAQYGLRNGIAMALHPSDGMHFLLGVDREANLPKQEMKKMRMMADLQLLAVHAQHAASRILVSESESDPDAGRPKLTPNEVAVLRWTMEGKSARDIGDILDLSRHTVVFHLRNASKKLDVSTKLQAVFKAVNLGLI